MIINSINPAQSNQKVPHRTKASFGQGNITLNGVKTALSPAKELEFLESAGISIFNGIFKYTGSSNEFRNIKSRRGETLKLLPDGIRINSADSELQFTDDGKMELPTKGLYDRIRAKLNEIQSAG